MQQSQQAEEKKKTYSHFSPEEDKAILEGVKKHGENWDLIIKEKSVLTCRTTKAIRQRFVTMTRPGKKRNQQEIREGTPREQVRSFNHVKG